MAEADSDSVLLDFLSSLMDYTPTIPDELAEHYLSRSGFQSPDIRVLAAAQVGDHEATLQPSFSVERKTYLYLSSNLVQIKEIWNLDRFYANVTRLVSLAAQKFIGEIASDALQYCKIRQASAKAGDKSRGQQGKDKRLILTTEDLASALHEYGVNIKRQEYFADSPAAGVAPPKDKTDE